jgi:hypothetical protein
MELSHILYCLLAQGAFLNVRCWVSVDCSEYELIACRVLVSIWMFYEEPVEGKFQTLSFLINL